MTMKALEHRERILKNLEIIRKREENNEIGGWVSKEEALKTIANGMGLLEHVSSKIKSQYRGFYTSRYTVVANREKVQLVFDRMVEQGYLKVSKSGNGVKILKTK